MWTYGVFIKLRALAKEACNIPDRPPYNNLSIIFLTLGQVLRAGLRLKLLGIILDITCSLNKLGNRYIVSGRTSIQI